MIFNLSLSELILLAILGGIWIIYVPICLYYWYKFALLHKHSKFGRQLALFLKVRHANLIHCITAACFLTMVIEIPYMVLANVFDLIPDLPFSTSSDRENDPIFELLHATLFYMLLYFMFVKFYLLYYNRKLSLAKTNLAWQMKINEKVTDWYIENTKRWGNPIWLTKISILPYLFTVALVVINDWFVSK